MNEADRKCRGCATPLKQGDNTPRASCHGIAMAGIGFFDYGCRSPTAMIAQNELLQPDYDEND